MTTEENTIGYYVQVFLPTGDPDGIKAIEKSNRPGRGLVIPRALLVEAKKRPEIDRPGVYLLVGESEKSRFPKVYIGEADPVRPRIEQHAKAKDFWTHAVVFTSDKKLNKAYIQHLESRLIGLALKSKKCTLDNGNTPQPPSLTEAEKAEVEDFLDDMLLCLPILGFGYFESPEIAPDAEYFELKAKCVNAKGFESAQGFVVLKGASAVLKEVPSIHPYLTEIRKELLQQGILKEGGEFYEFTQDYAFTSPSTAAGVLLGRTANGRKEWKTTTGKTLKEVQDEEIAEG